MDATPAAVAPTAPPEPARLSYLEAMASPCGACESAPCCRYLPLQTFTVTTFVELDYATYLLGFDRIELGLSPDGTWGAYYRQPCRYLDPGDSSCRVHGTSLQPHICVQYNPYTCWYRPALSGDLAGNHLRIDRTRMEFVLSRLEFDTDRKIVSAPAWEELQEAFAGMPMSVPDEVHPADDEVFERWRALALAGASADGAGETPRAFGEQGVQDPCADCSAHCCTALAFPMAPVSTPAGLDYARFALGFPGTEVVVADGEWQLVVRTTCRHLDGNRCSLFAAPQRPLRCQHYDAWTCAFKPVFGSPRPPRAVRVRLPEFAALASCYEFAGTGEAVEVPSTAQVRAAVEDGWRRGDLDEPVVIPRGRSLPLLDHAAHRTPAHAGGVG